MIKLSFYMVLIVSSMNLAENSPELSRKVSIFERNIQLPAHSKSLSSYARFYLVEEPAGTPKKNTVSKVVLFKYILMNAKPGIYLVSKKNSFPKDDVSDGGCGVINGAFRYQDASIIYIECNPVR